MASAAYTTHKSPPSNIFTVIYTPHTESGSLFGADGVDCRLGEVELGELGDVLAGPDAVHARYPLQLVLHLGLQLRSRLHQTVLGRPGGGGVRLVVL